jgi:arginyl-tRNA synthetase
MLPYIHDRGPAYGGAISEGPADAVPKEEGTTRRPKVVVEFSSPNMASDFTAAHLRSTIIGAYTAALYESMGWEVYRLNYIGDWGKQVGLLAAGWERFGDEALLEKEPLRHLLNVRTTIEKEFKPEVDASRKLRNEGKDTSVVESQGLFAERNAFFKKMEDDNEDALTLWKRLRDVSIEEYKKLYSRLNITFDEISSESEVNVDEAEAMLKEKGVAEDGDGALIVDFNKVGESRAHGTGVLRNREGTTNYLLRDIAAVLHRHKKYGFDKMIYVVSADQDQHFHRVFRAVELLGYSDLAQKLQHVNFSKVDEPPDSRLGMELILDDLLGQAGGEMGCAMKVNASKFNERLIEPTSLNTDILSIQAVTAHQLCVRRANHYTFNTKEMVSFDGYSGVRFQYWYARICAELRDMSTTGSDLDNTDFAELGDETYTDLLRLLAQYPDVVKSSYRTLEPSVITAYLYRLTDLLDPIFPDDDEEAENSLSGKEPPEPEAVESGEQKEGTAAEAEPPIGGNEISLEIREKFEALDGESAIRLKETELKLQEKRLELREKELQLIETELQGDGQNEKALVIHLTLLKVRLKELEVRDKELTLQLMALKATENHPVAPLGAMEVTAESFTEPEQGQANQEPPNQEAPMVEENKVEVVATAAETSNEVEDDPAEPQDEAKPELKAEHEKEAEPEQDAGVQNEAQPEAPAEPEHPAEPKEEAEPQNEAQLESQADPEHPAEPEKEVEPEHSDEPEKTADMQDEARPEAAGEHGKEAEPNQPVDSEKESAPEKEEDPEKESAAEIEAEPDKPTEAGKESVPEQEADPGKEVEPQNETEGLKENEPEKDAETQHLAAPENEPTPEKEANPESEASRENEVEPDKKLTPNDAGELTQDVDVQPVVDNIVLMNGTEPQDPNIAAKTQALAALYSSVRQVMENGMKSLGLVPIAR